MNKKLTVQELKEASVKMRIYSLISIYAAGSGHPGGSFSVMDITAALYLNIANLNPKDPGMPERDRIIYSAGHKAPAQYAGLGMAGFYSIEDMVTLRKINSPFQGHPHAPGLPGLEVSTGSLGQGLSISCGIALSGKLKEERYRVFCIMGDGEQQEGSIWEAVMLAGNYGLNNLIAVIDRNKLQIDGEVKNIMDISPLREKYFAFKWNVIEIDGHNMNEILDALNVAVKGKSKPTLIIADTVKGKGVSYMENKAEWHGKAPQTEEEFFIAIDELNTGLSEPVSKNYVRKLLEKADKYETSQIQRIDSGVPKYKKDYRWKREGLMKIVPEPNRSGFGRGLAEAGDDERIVTIHADISDSIRISDFEKADPERKNRVINAGIAEQDMITVAAGLAHEGWIPVTGTYGVFAAGRPWDQIRNTVCNDNLNVKIIGAHGGISVGPDGCTHQALEDIALMTVLPNMHVGVPCDSEEAKKMIKHFLFEIEGPCYLRLAREPTPVVTGSDTPFVFGRANIIRYRGESAGFKDAFSITFSGDYKSENEDLTIISCGPLVAEVMRAAYILKEEYDIESRIINMHTVKPIDGESVIKAAEETGKILTCEEHQTGGLGNIIAGILNIKRDSFPGLSMDMIGIDDRFGASGSIKELFNVYRISAEYIAERALDLAGKSGRV